MKRLSLIAIVLFTFIFVNAQDKPANSGDELYTVFGKGGNTKIGWFIGFDPR